MFGKIIILAMFENEDSIFVQQVAIQYEVWDLREFFQGVRWVGKDEIKLLLAGLQEAEQVVSLTAPIFQPMYICPLMPELNPQFLRLLLMQGLNP